MNKSASCLHILPCGNEGSFEYNICKYVKNGIEDKKEDKFFFEAYNHLRRLTTDRMDNLANKYNFKLIKEAYANQLYGSIDWISLSKPSFIFNMFNPERGINTGAKYKLVTLYVIIMMIKIARFPCNTIEKKRLFLNRYWYCFMAALLSLFYPFSKLINCALNAKTDAEWHNKRYQKCGSEMYLYYRR